MLPFAAGPAPLEVEETSEAISDDTDLSIDRPWIVLVWNDPINLMSYVVLVFQKLFGYENLLVCDGAALPANVGVNPSLTITALAEHAMSHVENA